MKTKVCNKCNDEKLFSQFPKNKTKKYGLDSWCKQCKSKCHSIYRNLNKEKNIKI